MSQASAFSAAATLVAGAFFLVVFERWTLRRSRHDAAWSIALAMFTIASFGLWAGVATEWSDVSYRIFYLFGAILNVPILALGTLYLLCPRHAIDRIALVVAAWCLVATGVLIAAPLRGELPRDGLPRAADHLDVLPRVLGVVSSSVGALVLIGGALWSAAGYARGAREPRSGMTARQMVIANALIASGTIVLGFGGSRVETATAFAATTAVGIATIFAGVLGTLRGARRPLLDLAAA